MVQIMNHMGNVMALVIAVATASMVIHTTEGAEYIVGDALGWTVPPGGAATYASWASKYHFVVQDTLSFKFAAGKHDVTHVTKENFEICNTTDPISRFQEPSEIEFLVAETFYFVCSFPGHCANGQKVAVHFAPSANTPSPSPSPSPPPSAAPAPPAAPPLKFVSKKLGLMRV